VHLPRLDAEVDALQNIPPTRRGDTGVKILDFKKSHFEFPAK
jgi:hypothetical protein